MPTLALICHPSTPCCRIERFDVRIGWAAGMKLTLHYVIEGDVGAMRIPPPVSSGRRDRLWESTCLEVFLRTPGSNAYGEFNFAPSTTWAAYAFDAYRDGMRPMETDPPPELAVRSTPDRLELDAGISGLADGFTLRERGTLRVGIAAVITELSGRRSYWALCHPSDQPDFHHPDSFALNLSFEEAPSNQDVRMQH